MKPRELRTFLSFFNSGGYVFDFSDRTFADFTISEINMNLKAKYNCSKGRSLEEFAIEYNEKEEKVVLKLFAALLNYYKDEYKGNQNDEQYIRCISLMEKLSSNPSIIDTQIMNSINQEYLNNNNQLIQKIIDEGDYDSAVSKCRTIVEECFCYGIELKGETIPDDGNLSNLRNKFEQLYDMVPFKNPSEIEKSINNLLSGINKIIDSLGVLRNKNSDAHGVGSSRIRFKEHHARLIANTARTLCEFLVSVINNKTNN